MPPRKLDDAGRDGSRKAVRRRDHFRMLVCGGALGLITLCFGLGTAGAQQMNSKGPIIQFVYIESNVTESAEVVKVPVVRSGELDSYVSVLCTTQALTAEAGFDFVERQPLEESVLLFAPGQLIGSCSVTLRDDSQFETEEILQLKLSDPESSGRNAAMIGSNATSTVRIVDDEYSAMIQLEQAIYNVKEPTLKEQVAIVTVNVVRSIVSGNNGSLNVIHQVRVSTEDGLATASVDYHPKSQLLTFGPGDSKLSFNVEVLHNPNNSFRQRSFRVILSTEKMVSSHYDANSFRGITVATIAIDDTSDQHSILPAPPIVVSLANYNVTNMLDYSDPSPGYPLICVTPCDPFFPDKGARLACLRSGISDATIQYSWEVAEPTSLAYDGYDNLKFKLLTVSTFFARVDERVLDSIFYRAGNHVRCVAHLSIGNAKGVPLKSKPILVGTNNVVCQLGTSAKERSFGFQSQPFVANLNYADLHDSRHPNRLVVLVEIPHVDGMIPLMSTFALDDVPRLLTDPFFRKHHTCSNMMFPTQPEVFLGGGFLQDSDLPYIAPTYLHQFNEKLRGNHTVLLYRHLDLKRCLWTFKASYHVTELVDLCGGLTTTDLQGSTVAKSSVTIRVPLRVTNILTSAVGKWISMEHRTEMDFSFAYDTVSWQSGVNVDNIVKASLQMLRILLNENGQMVLEFQTRAKFRGCFVLKHDSMPNYLSRIIPPNLLDLSFNLTIIRSSTTYDSPTQVWRAISNYSLKDYSGEYILELVPCIMAPRQANQQEINDENLLPCKPHFPQRFTLPISFYQVTRPVPAVYTLNTDFQVTSNHQQFLFSPTDTDLSVNDISHSKTFSRGQKVYGRVMWHPKQDLKSAYRLQIQQVYLCSGRDGYIPLYDPAGKEHSAGPQFGCLQPNKRLKHRLLVLDRNHLSKFVGHQSKDRFIQAVFAENDNDLHAMTNLSGVDGFSILIDSLFNLDGGYQWYLQVVYTITPSSQSLRWRRHTDGSSRNSRKQILASQNGTNIQIIMLTDTKSGTPTFNYLQDHSLTPLVATVSTVVVILSAVLIVVIAFTYYRHQHSTSPPPSPTEGDQKCDNADIIGSEGWFSIKGSEGRVCVSRLDNNPQAHVVSSRPCSLMLSHTTSSDVTEV